MARAAIRSGRVARLPLAMALAMAAGSSIAGGTRDFVFEPATLDLGGVQVGQSTTATVLLRSTGTEALVIDLVALRWQEPSMALSHDGCSGITLAAGAACSIDVTFTPTALGDRGERLGAETNSTVSDPLLEISAEGLPVDVPALSVTPASIAFPPRVVGELSASLAVFVNNVGSGAVTVSDAILQGSGSQHFLVSAPDACNVDGPLAPGGECVISVRFQPAAVGNFNATVRLDSNTAGSPHWVQLSGSGLASDTSGVRVDATALDFGTVFTGQSTAMTLTYGNTGSEVLTVAGFTVNGPDADAFLVTADACTGHLGVGADCSIAVRFSPTQVRGHVADVRIDVAADTLPPPVVLTGDGVPFTLEIFMDGFEP